MTLSVGQLRRFNGSGSGAERALKIYPAAGRMEMALPYDNGKYVASITPGKGKEVGFNIDYLRLFAAGAPGGEIRIQGQQVGSGAYRVLTENPDLVQVIMSMRI